MQSRERREQIMLVLNHRRQDTMRNLAAEFCVDVRTIRRDVDDLSLVYPLETRQGRYGGGVRLREGFFYVKRRYLNYKQQLLLRKLSKTLTGDDLAVMQSVLSDFAPVTSAL